MTIQKAPQALNRIRNLKGMDELKKLIEEWNIVAQNLNKMPKGSHIVLPNCLFAAQSGAGITRILGFIAQFLEEAGLFEFIGDIKYFEFVLDRSSNPENFPSFSRLIDYFHIAAGFRGVFKGIVCVDISEWVHELEDVRFLRFMEYASDFSEHVLFIFTIPLLDDKKVAEVETALAPYIRIRRLKLDFPKTDVLSQYLSERLQEYGFSLEEAAKSLLCETLSRSSELESFDGYNTLNHMVDEIIYEKCSQGLFENGDISVNDLSLFTPDGPWIKQLTRIKIARTKLGFNIGS